MARASKSDVLARLATLQRLVRRRNGPDTTTLTPWQLARYMQWRERLDHGLAMSPDDAATAFYARMSDPDILPLDDDIAIALGCYVAPLPADASEDDARAALERVLEQRRE